MKLRFLLTLCILQGASTFQIPSIAADSRAGVTLLSKSRVLENEDNGDDNNGNDYTWMQDYSLKFLGCHHVARWNSDAEEGDGNEVKIVTDRHVRFRLCPSSSCSYNTALGCTSGFGDYIVDMDTFLQSYLQNKEEIQEEQCQNRLNKCGCGQNDDDDDEKCEYKCYKNAGMSQCIENNPYYDDGEQDGKDNFDIKDYTYCAQYKIDEEDENKNRHRHLDEAEVQYFLGAYCADKGDDIHLGLFVDDTCTEFADSDGGATTFYENFGIEMPYEGESLVSKSCFTCKDYQYYGGDVGTRELCENTYMSAGKCESKISGNAVANPNENACNYIEGIKVLKHSPNGIIYRQYRGSKKAAIAIAIFAATFFLLAFYVCFLRKQIKLKQQMSIFPKKRRANRKVETETSPTEKRGFFRTIAKSLSPKSMKKKFSFRNSNSKRSKKEGALL